MYTIFLSLLAAAAPALLVTPADLAAAPGDWQVVDTRSAEAYAAGHIPGARHLDPDTLSENRNDVSGLLRPVDELAVILGQAGLDPRQPVLVYSAMEKSSDLKRATRLFWVLEYLSYTQVAILDGGFARWVREDNAVSNETEAIAPLSPAQLNLRPRPELLATREEVAKIIEKQDGILVDNRPTAQYIGIEQSGATAKAGHIDGACNLPVDELLDSTTMTVKQGAALEEVTAAVPDKKKVPVITYCNTGRDATAGYFGLRLKGIDNVAVYDGSMSEWSRLPQLGVQE